MSCTHSLFWGSYLLKANRVFYLLPHHLVLRHYDIMSCVQLHWKSWISVHSEQQCSLHQCTKLIWSTREQGRISDLVKRGTAHCLSDHGGGWRQVWSESSNQQGTLRGGAGNRCRKGKTAPTAIVPGWPGHVGSPRATLLTSLDLMGGRVAVGSSCAGC